MKTVLRWNGKWVTILIAVLVAVFASSMSRKSSDLHRIKLISPDDHASTAISSRLRKADGDHNIPIDRAAETNDYRSVSTMLQAKPSNGFAEIWLAINQFSGTSDEKRELVEQLIHQMCAAGRTTEAMEYIQKSFGSGGLKPVLLQSLFRISPLSIGELRELRKSLETESDRYAASSGIMTAIANLDEARILELRNLDKLDEAERTMLLNGLRLHMEAVEQRQGDSKSALQNLILVAGAIDLKDNQSPGFGNSLLRDVSLKSPFEVWSFVCSSAIADKDPGLQGFVAARMAKSDPRRAMSAVLETGDSATVGAVFTHWLQYDSKEATTWYESKIGAITKDTQNHVSAALAENAARQGELEQARNLSETITDPEQRRRVDNQIWTAERDLIRKDVGIDPGGTVLSIVSGQSKYGDYWIEEAMSTWVAKDFDKAQDWYQKNWNSMPANKSQYLAAAFAKQAATQGDVATAREWAAHIQDAKTKQRIEAEIAKAAPNKEN